MVKVREIIETSFKRFHAGTAALRALDPAAGHCRPLPEIQCLHVSCIAGGFFTTVPPGKPVKPSVYL